ncbi:unnamed protein product [Vitrella brassicaformis CCMP3155]|uniref:Uncharacterized protein n=1 Tax=Vitrella brassicaformis (strain CCMP3155) TaxID=1169540 RepID=A0A0G4H2D1_VITBC|nr:unnamed protein product [Vitrella brassicaformis CCMP3155]|eukprot:CEM37607.1 unnamed protein product [Vitrella brassicaformis CCMP3155]
MQQVEGRGQASSWDRISISRISIISSMTCRGASTVARISIAVPLPGVHRRHTGRPAVQRGPSADNRVG